MNYAAMQAGLCKSQVCKSQCKLLIETDLDLCFPVKNWQSKMAN